MAINPAGLRFKQSGSTSGTSITKPNLTIQGDLMVVCAAGSSAPTPPAGWSTITTSGVYGSLYFVLFAKIHGDEAGTTSYTFTGSSYIWIATYAGADVYAPIGAVGAWESETSTTTPTYSGLTTTVAGSTAFAMCQDYVSESTFTAPSGWTERVDAIGGTFDDKSIATPGATGSMDWTASMSANFCMVALEILPSTVRRRLYFDSAASAEVTPSSWSAQWDLNTGGAITRRLNDTRGSSSLTWCTYTDASATNNQDSAMYRGVIKLGTGYIQGGFHAVLQCAESSSSANDFSQISLKIIQPGGTDRAVLYAGHTSTATSGSEFPASTSSPYQASAANRYFPKATLSRNMTAAWSYEGDFLVVEIGYRQNSTGTTYVTNMYVGEPSSTDLTDVNETETTNNTPWIEFPNGLVLSGEGPDMKQAQVYMRRL